MKRMHLANKNIYRELTFMGTCFCAVAGLLFEFVVLFISGINPLFVSVPVLLFLWLLSGIIVSGLLHAVAIFADLLELPLTDTGDDGMISSRDMYCCHTIFRFVS